MKKKWRYNDERTFRHYKSLREWRCPNGHWIMFTIIWRGHPNVCPQCVPDVARGGTTE